MSAMDGPDNNDQLPVSLHTLKFFYDCFALTSLYSDKNQQMVVVAFHQ